MVKLAGIMNIKRAKFFCEKKDMMSEKKKKKTYKMNSRGLKPLQSLTIF